MQICAFLGAALDGYCFKERQFSSGRLQDAGSFLT